MRSLGSALRLALVAGLAVLPLGMTAAEAKSDKSKGAGHDYDAGDVIVDAVITAAEIAIIHDYVARYGAAPFGPVQGLPPGIAKNYARGKPLPPGIAKKALPAGLAGLLPPRPGYEWGVVDHDIVLLVAGTMIVADILRSAF